MARYYQPAGITYPPELLPRADGDEAEVVVCCGGDKCSKGVECDRRSVVAAPPKQGARLN